MNERLLFKPDFPGLFSSGSIRPFPLSLCVLDDVCCERVRDLELWFSSESLDGGLLDCIGLSGGAFCVCVRFDAPTPVAGTTLLGCPSLRSFSLLCSMGSRSSLEPFLLLLCVPNRGWGDSGSGCLGHIPGGSASFGSADFLPCSSSSLAGREGSLVPALVWLLEESDVPLCPGGAPIRENNSVNRPTVSKHCVLSKIRSKTCYKEIINSEAEWPVTTQKLISFQ